MKKSLLYDLLDMESTEAVLAEVFYILDLMFPGNSFDRIQKAFNATSDLYHGRYPGYRECTTGYHDFQHIYETFLATARLAHGVVLAGISLPSKTVILGLTAALLHDSGYIQESEDKEGTGGKHTIIHVKRSMEFVERNAPGFFISRDEIRPCQIMIYCTDLAADFGSIIYPSREIELMGKILAASDLLAQMAGRTHLEKLLYLYQEFREGMVGDYESAEDLLRKTVGFYDLVKERFERKLDGVDRYMRLHFKQRWGVDQDLYHLAIEHEKEYLCKILSEADRDMLDHLRRKGIIAANANPPGSLHAQ